MFMLYFALCCLSLSSYCYVTKLAGVPLAKVTLCCLKFILYTTEKRNIPIKQNKVPKQTKFVNRIQSFFKNNVTS